MYYPVSTSLPPLSLFLFMNILPLGQVLKAHILLLGMSADCEQEQTVEFYKIRLMEKDREIADFTAKMKKVEFKHNRQLKEATIAKERAEKLLKDEKERCDKQTKAAQQHAQQNQVLQLRLQEMRREKQREVTDISAKYNTLKEEVRSYQRILPTFTFLNELALTIAELPNYEDLFLTSREKTAECERLMLAQRQAEQEWDQVLKGLRANEELLRGKRAQAEKNLKEVVAKLVEQENQMSDLRLQNQQLIDNCLTLEEELQLTRERCQSLEDSVREYEYKMERLAEQFQVQMAGREDQLVRGQRGEMEQLEEELRGQEAQMQRREAMFSQQVRILQEEITFLNGKYQAQVETFEEHYLTLKEDTERMRAQILAEKRRYDELQECYSGSTANLNKITTLYEQAQQRNRQLEQRIASYEQRLAQQSKANQQEEQERFEDLQRQYEELWQKLQKVGEHCGKVQQERDQLQEENYLLREELSNNQLLHNESKSFFLQLPKPDEKIRKKSSEIDSPNPIIQGIRERRNSTQIGDLEKKNEMEVQRRVQSQNKSAILQNENWKLRSQLDQLRKQKEKLLNDSITLKQKIITLTRANMDHQKTAYGHSTKNKLDRTKLDSLEEELRHLSEECKREKEANKKLRQQTKTAKEAHVGQLERLTKQVKQSLTQIETTKAEKERLRVELLSKEKSYNHEAALLKNSRQLQEIFKQQIKQLKQQKQTLQAEFLQLQNTLLKANEQSIILRKETQRLEEHLKQAQRETQMANESLQRERKERSLLTVPSLHSIGQQAQDETFNQIYATIPQKEGEINLLQRSIQDLKEQLQTVRLTNQVRTQAMQAENSYYVQTIIQMKMRCAQSEMRASQKEYLYVQLKKRAAALNISIK